jgi:hypothetical protein
MDRSKSDIVLLPTPGLTRIVQLPHNKCVQGSYAASDGRMFFVCNNTLYEIDERGKQTQRGVIDTGDENTPVSMTDNGVGVNDPIIIGSVDTGQVRGKGLIVVNGFCGYMLNLTTDAWTKIDGGIFTEDMVGGPGFFPQCSHVVFINGKFVVNQINTQRMYFSDLYDGFHWSADNYIEAEGAPDNVQAIFTINKELGILGDRSLEFRYDTGSSFDAIHGAFFNNGTVAPYSVAVNGNNVFWLGSSEQGHGQVWTANNYQPQKISNPAIDFVIENLPNISDAIGMCYTKGGHNFYLITFRSGNMTLCYDLTTGMWHTRGAFDSSIGTIGRHRASCMCSLNNSIFCGDYQNGKIYRLDEDKFTDDGVIVRRVRTGSHLHSMRKRLFYNKIEIDVQRGIGTESTAQGYDPQAMLQWSDDGGFKWSNEKWRSFGKIGEFLTRLKWDRCGYSRDRVYRLSVSDPNKVVLINGFAEVKAEV